MKSTNKILSVAVILLLLVNIGLVVYMLKGRNNHGPRKTKDPFEMMVKELGMSEKQQSDYKSQKEEHFKLIRPAIDSLRKARIAMFSLVREPNVNDSIVDDYSRRIAEQQAIINKLTLNHFRKVRNVFTPEQQPKFDEFIKKIMQKRRDSSGKK